MWCGVVKNVTSFKVSTEFTLKSMKECERDMSTVPLYFNVSQRGGLKLIYLVCIMCSRLTLSETDSVRRESYKQQQVTHFMVERSPSQTLRLGSNSRGMTEHQQPFFNTSRDHEQTEQKPVTLGKEDKQEVTAVTQDISKPVRVNFRASSLMSSPRDTSQRVQRREWHKEVEDIYKIRKYNIASVIVIYTLVLVDSIWLLNCILCNYLNCDIWKIDRSVLMKVKISK